MHHHRAVDGRTDALHCQLLACRLCAAGPSLVPMVVYRDSPVARLRRQRWQQTVHEAQEGVMMRPHVRCTRVSWAKGDKRHARVRVWGANSNWRPNSCTLSEPCKVKLAFSGSTHCNAQRSGDMTGCMHKYGELRRRDSRRDMPSTKGCRQDPASSAKRQ